MVTRIQYRRDTAANWLTANPVLAQGEAGYETDTNLLKIGDGVTGWVALPYPDSVTPETVAANLPARLGTEALNATYATREQLTVYPSKSATGYTGSSAFVQDATLSPSPVDARNLSVPSRKTMPVLDTALPIGQRRNVWQYTENVNSNRYTAQNAVKQLDILTTADGVVLTRVSLSNFYSSLRSQVSGMGFAPFTPGNRYLLSFYVLATSDKERFFWMRGGTNTRAHGQRLLQPGTLTRVWKIAQATTTQHLSDIDDPTVGFSATNSDPNWFASGNQSTDGDGYDIYIGGFQIETIPATSLDGIAVIGDSTIQGASGGSDSGAARETVGYLAGLLNVTTYNRAIGGNTTLAMDTRWATDVTPLKGVCKYALIQGGINDISQGRILADIQGNITSMVAKAKTDGLTPVLLNCTPTQSIAADPAKETMRLELNSWMVRTFPNVVDIAAVVADPFDKKLLRRTPGANAGWYGDGVHYTRQAKRAIAEKIAAWYGWAFTTPSPYQRIAIDTFAPAGAIVLSSPDGTQYKLTVANGGSLTATAV